MNTRTTSPALREAPVSLAHVDHLWQTIWVGDHRTELVRLGSGSPVVFLHGWGMSPRSYLQGLREISRHGRSVFAPSLPGFGNSDALPIRHQGVQGVAEHIARLLDELDLGGPVELVGHSFGGGVALKLAAQRPDLVRVVTLISPVGGAGDGAVPLRTLLRGAVGGNKVAAWAPKAIVELFTSLRSHPPAVVRSAIAAWQSDQVEDVIRAEAAQVPVRILFSSEDKVVRPGPIPAHARTHVRVETVPGAHSWLLGEPERFAAEVVASSPADAALAAA